MAGFPDRLVTTGPYAYSRNPMYLGHLIFSVGLLAVFRSPIAAFLLFMRVIYFTERVARDEARLRTRFGADYEAYASHVKRWVPGLL